MNPFRKTFRERPPSSDNALTGFDAFSHPATGTIWAVEGWGGNHELRRLFSLYGSDKGHIPGDVQPYSWQEHNYWAVYGLILQPYRMTAKLVVECGIGSNDDRVPSNMTRHGRPGASLRAWRDFFPYAEVIGIDVDEAALFTEDRIRTFAVDQTSQQSIFSFVETLGNRLIDIVIDDGLHTFVAGASLFDGLFPKVKTGGLYVIEDVRQDDVSNYVDWFRRRNLSGSIIQIAREGRPTGDNRLVVVHA